MIEAKESEVVPSHDPEAIPFHDGPEIGYPPIPPRPPGWLPTPIAAPSLSRATVVPDSEAPEVVEPNDLDIQPAAQLQGPIADVPELDEKPNEGRNLLDGPLRFRHTLKKSCKGDARQFRLWVIGCIAVIVAISLAVGLAVGLQHQSSSTPGSSVQSTTSMSYNYPTEITLSSQNGSYASSTAATSNSLVATFTVGNLYADTAAGISAVTETIYMPRKTSVSILPTPSATGVDECPSAGGTYFEYEDSQVFERLCNVTISPFAKTIDSSGSSRASSLEECMQFCGNQNTNYAPGYLCLLAVWSGDVGACTAYALTGDVGLVNGNESAAVLVAWNR